MSESFSVIVTIAAAPAETPVIALNGGRATWPSARQNRSGDLLLLDGRDVRAS